MTLPPNLLALPLLSIHLGYKWYQGLKKTYQSHQNKSEIWVLLGWQVAGSLLFIALIAGSFPTLFTKLEMALLILIGIRLTTINIKFSKIDKTFPIPPPNAPFYMQFVIISIFILIAIDLTLAFLNLIYLFASFNAEQNPKYFDICLGVMTLYLAYPTIYKLIAIARIYHTYKLVFYLFFRELLSPLLLLTLLAYSNYPIWVCILPFLGETTYDYANTAGPAKKELAAGP